MSKPTSEWWRGATIYQIYPRSFADSNGDGVGDLPGITAHLDYVALLGVDGVWLSPFFTSPMADYGYDVADYCDVDPIFGTLADFDALLAKAHALGLKVIIDQVYAHTSDAHAWFKESRASRTNAKADWYVWADAKPDGAPPSNWQSVFGGPAWTWDARREQYYMHNFLAAQPQLNVHNPDVQDALLGVAKFWLDRGVDGFRLDAINFAFHNRALTDNPPETKPGKRTRPFDFQQKIHNMSQPELIPFVARIRALTDHYPGSFTVAEVGGDAAEHEMKLLTAGQSRLNTAYSFAFLNAARPTPQSLAEVIGGWDDAPGVGWPSWAFSNHDAPRVVTRWGGDDHSEAEAKLLMMLLLSLRGNPFIYQGEELGLVQADVPFERLLDPEAIANWPQTQGRDGARTPMPWTTTPPYAGFSACEPWLPIDPRHVTRAVSTQQNDPRSVLAFTRQMLRVRRDHSALRTGATTFLPTAAPVLAFTRGTGPDAVLCVFNLGTTAASFAPVAQGETVIALADASRLDDQVPARGGYIARMVR